MHYATFNLILEEEVKLWLKNMRTLKMRRLIHHQKEHLAKLKEEFLGTAYAS